jgi:formylglycine-generating enzyme required for sulfatase activity
VTSTVRRAIRVSARSRARLLVLALLAGASACDAPYDHARAARLKAEHDARLGTIARMQTQVSRAPEDRAARLALAKELSADGQYDEAQRAFEQALRMSGDRETALRLVTLLYARGRYMAAAALARRWMPAGADPINERWLHELFTIEEAAARHAVAANPASAVDSGGAANPHNAAAGERPDGVVNSIGMDLVSVPGGQFNRGDASGDEDERPVRAITLSPYLIGRYEVTVGQFKTFLKETGFRPQSSKSIDFYGVSDTYPAFGIAWFDARAFTIWLSVRERRVYRLPTEAEWELAARGPQGNREPWGNDRGRPQVDGNWGRLDAIGTNPPPLRDVGSFPRDRSFFGLFDMAGNVAEWCLDDYDPTYYAWSPDRDPHGPWGGDATVLRGGAWNHPDKPGLAVRRGKAGANQPYTGFGFRVVREPDS